MPSASALQAIRNAVYTTLNANGTLSGKVYNEPPQNQALPLVLIGEAVEEPFDTFTKQGKRVDFIVTCWSSYAGLKEAEDYHNLVIGLLNYATVSVAGYQKIMIRFERAQTVGSGSAQRGIEAHYIFTLQET